MANSKEKLSPEQIEKSLDQFCGTEDFHQTMFRNFLHTDGVKFLADQAGAYWLIDLIGSHQPAIFKRKPRAAAEFQVWKLNKTEGGAMIRAHGEDGYGNKIQIASQRLDYTDFPLKEITLWVELGSIGHGPVLILMLPGER